jgi:predicted amidophosphoribosyltransferase
VLGWLADAARDLALGTACLGCGRPGRAVCGACHDRLPTRGRPAWPTPRPPGLATPWAAGPYDGVLRAMVLAHKERGAFSLAAPLGDVLAAVVACAVPDGEVTLVPVASRAAVVRRRGHDPMLRASRRAAARLRAQGVPAVVRGLLAPVGRVQDQAGLGAAERTRNLAGSMRARSGAAPVRGRVVVVDDVVTTGATLREAQRALHEGGYRVHAHAVVAATARRSNSGGSLPLGRNGD